MSDSVKVGSAYIEISGRLDRLERAILTGKNSAKKGAEQMERSLSSIKANINNQLMKKKISEVEEMHRVLKKKLEEKISLDVNLKSIERTRTALNQVESSLQGLKREAPQTNDQLNNIIGNLKNIAATAGIAFGVSTLISWGKEAFTAAAKAEGINSAFKKLNDPSLLGNLRKATRDTIDDLTLMQVTLRAKNFKIPLNELATYLEFATKRARQTGESVDYLVNSIVDGIGRKSSLVLDNLGISATELQKEVEKVGDFGIATGNIVRRELKSMGSVALTTADEIDQIAASLKNVEVSAGDLLINSVKGMNTYLKALAKGGLGGVGLFLGLDESLHNALQMAEEQLSSSNKYIVEAANKASQEIANKNAQEIQLLIDNTERKIASMRKLNSLSKDDQNTIDQLNSKLNVYKERIRSITEIFNPYGKKISDIKTRIKELTEQQESMIFASDAYKKNVEEIARLEKLLKNDDSDNNKLAVLKELGYLSQTYFDERVKSIQSEAKSIRENISQLDAELYLYKELKKVAQEYKDFFEIIPDKKGAKDRSPDNVNPVDKQNKPKPFQETENELINQLELIDTLEQGYLSLANSTASAGSSMLDSLTKSNNALLKIIGSFGEAITQALIFKTVMGLFGLEGGFAGISIFSSIGKKQGGSVTNTGNKIIDKPYKKFASGVRDFKVPGGFYRDNYFVGVQSGETLNVTPAGQNNSFSDSRIVRRLMTLEKTMESMNINFASMIASSRNTKQEDIHLYGEWANDAIYLSSKKGQRKYNRLN